MSGMRRRDFVALLGGAAAWPVVARAQQPAVPVIGYLSPTSPIGAGQSALTAIRRGLRDTGFVEGQNVTVEYRWAEGQLDRLPALAADLVRRHVSVIATSGGLTSARAASAVTSTIPIVFLTASDPVQLGVVASLSRPGGNITGVTTLVRRFRASSSQSSLSWRRKRKPWPKLSTPQPWLRMCLRRTK